MGIDAARALTTINKGCSSIEIPLKETTKPYGTLHPREVKNNTNKVGNSKTHDYPEDKDPFSENIPTKPLDCNTRSLNPFDDDKDDSETDSSSGSPYPSGKNPFSENDGDNHQIITKSTSKNPFGDDEDYSETHSFSETDVDLPASTEAESLDKQNPFWADMQLDTENIIFFKKIADQFLEDLNNKYLNQNLKKHSDNLKKRLDNFIQPSRNENKFEWIPEKEPKTKEEFDDIIKTIKETSKKSGQLYNIAEIFEKK